MEYIRDDKLKVIGWYNDFSDRIELVIPGKGVVGTYWKDQNITKASKGKFVGQGNQLGRLICR